jgi:hypothetical protein
MHYALDVLCSRIAKLLHLPDSFIRILHIQVNNRSYKFPQLLGPSRPISHIIYNFPFYLKTESLIFAADFKYTSMADLITWKRLVSQTPLIVAGG